MRTRNTEQKRLILDILAAERAPVSADYIYGKAGMKLVKSTIYRNLGALAEKGNIERHYLESGVALYRLRADRHQHFIICNSCRKAAPIPGCNLRALEKKTELETGFSISGHYMQMVGTCKKCSKEAK